MIVDTSAWVEYTRRTDSPFDLILDDAIRNGRPMATPAPVVMELLVGCNTEVETAELLQLLSRFEILIPDSLRDYENAALIYRTCRQAGFTIRSIVDCMVAAAALREGRPVLARNRDFDVIARLTDVELVVPQAGASEKPPRGWSGE